MDHLVNNAILSDFQHGFRQKRSCDTQLIQTVHDLAKCLHDGEQVDAVLLDLSKALYKVPHARLEAELDYYGIRGNTLAPVDQMFPFSTLPTSCPGGKNLS